jgi:NMD protein affecting ribosome stability and mRNA decay
MVRSLEGKHPAYFEAVLQLRDITSEILDYVDQDIDKYKIPVTKFKKVKNGYDYYLADKNYTRALGKRLQQKFGGQNILTTSLVGKKLGKDLHRFTVLFRCTPFRKNDIVEYNGEEGTIISVNKEIVLRESKTGKKHRIKFKDLKLIKNIN